MALNGTSTFEMIYIDDHGEEALIIGEVDLDDDPAMWSFWMIAQKGLMPNVHSMTVANNPHGKVTFNPSLPGWNYDGKPYIKMALMYGSSDLEIGDDWCPKCKVRADFVRCALKCPQCGDFLGGC